MHGIVALLIFVGMLVAAVAFVRSRPRAEVFRAPAPEPEGFAEFVARVERETGRHLDLPPAAPAPIARPAPRAAQPPPQPPPQHKHVSTATPHKRRPRSGASQASPPQPVAPPARSPLPALGVAPPLRPRAFAALAPLEPVAPLAPRAVRSP